MMIRRLFVLALLAAAVSCGHKTETQSTTTTGAANAPTAATAATPGAMSVKVNPSTAGGTVATGAGQPPGFDTEAGAQGHCPSDQVVWLNTKSHVYHEKGMVYYGHTKAGAYVCRKEADAAGDRDAKNGK